MSAIKEGEFVRVHAGDFEALLAENRRLYAQVKECQTTNAALLERARTAEARWDGFWAEKCGDQVPAPEVPLVSRPLERLPDLCPDDTCSGKV